MQDHATDALPDEASNPPGFNPPTSLSRWQLVRMSALWFGLQFFWVSQQLIVMPERVKHFAPPELLGTYYGLIKAGGAIIVIITQLTVGFISDHAEHKLGKRRPFIIHGVLWGCAGIVLFVLAPNYWMLFIAYLILEFFINAASVPFQALLPDLVPKTQHARAGALMSLYHLAGNLVGVLVMVAMHLFFGGKELNFAGNTLPLGYITLLLPMYLLLIIGTLLVVYFGVDEKGWAQHVKEKLTGAVMQFRILPGTIVRFAKTAPTALGCIVNDYRKIDIKGKPNLSWLAVSRFVIFLGYQTFMTYIAYYTVANLDRREWVRSMGISEGRIDSLLGSVLPTILACFILGGLVGSIVARRLQEGFGKKNTIILGMVMSGVMVIPIIFTSNAWVVVSCGAVMGCGWGMFLAADWSFACTLMPKDKAGAYMGLWDMTTLIPQVIAPVLAAPLRDGIYNARLEGYVAELGQEAGELAAEAMAHQWLYITCIIYFLIGLFFLRYVKENRLDGLLARARRKAGKS